MRGETKARDSQRLSRISIRRILQFGLALIATLALSMLAVPRTFADGGREIRLQDKCDSTTFNAVLGDGVCVGDGNVTFDQLIATLNPADGGHDAWRFSRETLGIKAGEVVHVTNTGGEAHSFTEVFNFGTGFAGPPLDDALPPGTPPATPIIDPDPNHLEATFIATIVLPRESRDIAGLSAGTHNFQCLLHPWMRTVITVKGR